MPDSLKRENFDRQIFTFYLLIEKFNIIFIENIFFFNIISKVSMGSMKLVFVFIYNKQFLQKCKKVN